MSFLIATFGYVAGICVGYWVCDRKHRLEQDGIGDADEYKVGGTD